MIAGFAVAMVVTVGFAWLMDAFGPFTEEMVEADSRVRHHLEPDWMSFVVAGLAGIAGTLSLTSAKSGA